MRSFMSKFTICIKTFFVLALLGLFIICTVTSLIHSNRIKNEQLEYYTGSYSIQKLEFTKGWLITMDNGEDYYFNMDASDNISEVIDELYRNQGKTMTISALPSHFLRVYDRRLVSLSLGDKLILDSEATLKHYRTVNIIFMPLATIILVFLLLGLVIHIWTYEPARGKRKKKLTGA